MTTLQMFHSEQKGFVRIVSETKGRAAQTTLLPLESLYSFCVHKHEIINADLRPFRRATKITKEKQP